jgi:hypothetical protein
MCWWWLPLVPGLLLLWRQLRLPPLRLLLLLLSLPLQLLLLLAG